jgi:hypothetical protein
MSAGRPQRPLRVHTGGRWANVGRTSVRSVRSPRTPACHRRQRGHVCRTQPVRTVVIPEAADGQSADRAGSLQLPLLLLKAGPAAGSDTAVIGETASPSTRHGTNLSPAGYAAPTSAGVTVQADSRSSAPWPCRCSADLGTGSRHAGHGTLAQRSDDDADATAAPTSQPRVTDNTGHQRAANAQLSRSPRPASQVVRPPRFSLGQGDSLPAARLGRLPTRQVVVVNGPHPPVQLVTIAATLERADNTDHYRSARRSSPRGFHRAPQVRGRQLRCRQAPVDLHLGGHRLRSAASHLPRLDLGGALGHVWGMKQGTAVVPAGSCALALTSGGGSEQRRSSVPAVYGMQVLMSDRMGYAASSS